MTHAVHRLPATFDDPIERTVVADVLAGKSYPLPPTFSEEVSIRVIVDIGAHVGAAAVWFHSLWPSARIVCFEPAHDCVELLKENAPFAEIRQVAVAGFSGTSLLNSAIAPASRSIGRQGDWMIDTVDAFEVFGELQPDVLKIDTEGLELEILMRRLSAVRRCTLIYLEYHRWSDRPQIDALLSPTHILFRASTTYSHNRGDLAYIRKDAIAPHVLNDLFVKGGDDA